MNTELMAPQPLPALIVSPLEEPEEKPQVPEEIKLLSRLKKALRLPDAQFRPLHAAMGSFKRNPDRLESGDIFSSQYAAWNNGTEPMPRWRLAQAVVLAEFLGCLRTYEANAILAADVPKRRKMLARMELSTLRHMRGDLAALEEREDIQEFLGPFRRALYLRLKADAHLSDRDALHCKLWAERCVTLPEPKPSKKQKRGNRRTRQAA